MGNNSSSQRHHRLETSTVDGGHPTLQPGNVYTGVQDWDQRAVRQLIIDRRLAPFYKGLADYDDNWDERDIWLALHGEKTAPRRSMSSSGYRPSSSSAVSAPTSGPASSAQQIKSSFEYFLYKSAIECPICFLYYPSNINRTRCCDQPICTECFVQIKRVDITSAEQQSEPTSCPYCVQNNFGIFYDPPPLIRSGLSGQQHSIKSATEFQEYDGICEGQRGIVQQQHASTGQSGFPTSSCSSPSSTSPDPSDPTPASPPQSTTKSRRKSYAANDPRVVTSDDIRPDWEERVQRTRREFLQRAAAVASHRRLIVRTLGPNGEVITTTLRPGGRRAQAAAAAAAAAAAWASQNPERLGSLTRNSTTDEEDAGGNNSRRLGGLRSVGQELEDLMVMEAIRLSLQEEEERNRRQQNQEQERREEEEQSVVQASNDRRALEESASSRSETVAAAETGAMR